MYFITNRGDVMGARFCSWWQNIRKPLDKIIITLLVVLLALFVVIILGYIFHWDWTGLNEFNSISITTNTASPPQKITRTIAYQPGKTLWDWLQLLIIPAVLAVGGYLFNYTTSKNEQQSTQLRDQNERDIASDNQREAALQGYIDKISELLLDKDHPLRESAPEDEVRKIARVRTLTVLPRLDKERKRSVLQFLHESGLIDKDNRIIDLRGADLREAILSFAHLSDAHLLQAHLSFADLRGADLNLANLSGASVVSEQLSEASSLKDTILPDGSKHSD